MAGRIACISVPDFPLAAALRSDPDLGGRAVAVCKSLDPHPGERRARKRDRGLGQVITASSAALALGVRPGMTVAQARSAASDLTVIPASEAAGQSAQAALLDAAESFSPVVEDASPGCVYLSLAGLGSLHGPESEMASELIRRIRAVGLEASVGIAANKEIAWLAARCGGTRVIDPGRETEFLNWLPIDLLRLDDTLAESLGRWGIRRLGELARLDPRQVGTRLGSAGVAMVRIARGEVESALVPRLRAELFSEKVELDYGVEMLEAFGFVIRAALERLLTRVAVRGYKAGDIRLGLELSGHLRNDRRIAVAAATTEIRPLLALIILSLENTPPPAAIEALEISIEPRHPRPAQSDMFLPPAPAPDRLQATLARLAAICGPGHVGSLLPADSHRPEACRHAEFAPPPPPAAAPQLPARAVTAIVIRALRPPQPVEVLCQRGIPEFVRGRELSARVVSIAGPWRRQGEWWSEQAFNRDYYEMALADGGVYRVFCDRASQQWFVDGVYD